MVVVNCIADVAVWGSRNSVTVKVFASSVVGRESMPPAPIPDRLVLLESIISEVWSVLAAPRG